MQRRTFSGQVPQAARSHGRGQPKATSAHGSEDGPAVVLPSEYRHYRGKISLDIHKVPAAEFAHASQEQPTMVACKPERGQALSQVGPGSQNLITPNPA